MSSRPNTARSPTVLILAAGAYAGSAPKLVAALGGIGVPARPVGPLSALAHVHGNRADCVVSCGPLGHVLGALMQRLGTPWLAVQDEPWPSAPGFRGVVLRRLELRLMRSPAAVVTHIPAVADDLHLRIGGNVALLGEDGDGFERQLDAAVAQRRPARSLRVLMLGPTNTPHLEHVAMEMHQAGVEVFVGGIPWQGGLPRSSLSDAGIPVISTTWPPPLWLRRMLRRVQPDVVHAHWLPNAVLAGVAGARPLVATAWGSDVHLATRRQRLAARWLLSRAEAVTGDSRDLIDHLIGLGAPRSRTHLLNWGVDLERFRPPVRSRAELRDELGLGGGPVILSVRGFKSLNNPDVVIAGFERLAARRDDVQLVLKHNSTDPPELPQLRFPNRVHVVGAVAHERLAAYYQSADVCISIPSTDSSPRSVWEAMACGCPCVLSDLRWVRESIEPGVHALAVPIDVAAVVSALSAVLEEAGLAGKLSTNARALVERDHDRRVEMDRLRELYERLAAGPPTSTGPS